MEETAATAPQVTRVRQGQPVKPEEAVAAQAAPEAAETSETAVLARQERRSSAVPEAVVGDTTARSAQTRLPVRQTAVLAETEGPALLPFPAVGERGIPEVRFHQAEAQVRATLRLEVGGGGGTILLIVGGKPDNRINWCDMRKRWKRWKWRQQHCR